MQKIIKLNEAKQNKALRFHIFNKLFKYHFIDENYGKSIKALKFALEIRPDDIITNVCLAETYEYIGNGEKAIETYENTKNMCSLSSKLSSYMDEQIKRVSQKGPRKAPPIPGIRYGTF